MKKTVSLIILQMILIILSVNAYAADYVLKRTVVTWPGPTVDDSYTGQFQATGTMNINGMIITQSIRFCTSGICENAAESASGTIVSISENTAQISVRRHEDGIIDDLTILTLSPNIITMYVYEDGTVETHEWEPTNIFTSISQQQHEAFDFGTDPSAPPRGRIGAVIADALKN